MKASLQVQVVAPTGRDGPLICEMLARRGLNCRSYVNVVELCGEVTDDLGAIVLTEEALAPGALDELDAMLRVQPVWSDIGIVLLTSNSDRVQGAVNAKLGR